MGPCGAYDLMNICCTFCVHAVSAKFVYDSDISIVGNPAGEYKEFVDAIAGFFDVVSRMLVEPPLYKLYNSELSRKFVECQKVCLRNVIIFLACHGV